MHHFNILLVPRLRALLRCPTTRCYRISLVDRCANKYSLYRPPDALVCVARHHLSTTPNAYVLFNIKNKNGGEEGIRTLVACAKRFSRPPRYDRFDTSPCDQVIVTQTKLIVNTKIYFMLHYLLNFGIMRYRIFLFMVQI